MILRISLSLSNKFPNFLAPVGHISTQAGYLPFRTLWRQKVHFSTTLFGRGLFPRYSVLGFISSLGIVTEPQLNFRAPYGHAAIQLRHPIHQL